MQVEINYLGVLLAAVASMVVGGIFYAKPVFGEIWGRLVKLDEKQMKKGAPMAMGMAFAAALLTAYIMAHVAYISNQFYKDSFMADSIMTGFWLWLGISATTLITHNAFEQKRKKLTLINLAFQLVSLIAMAVVIGWLKP